MEIFILFFVLASIGLIIMVNLARKLAGAEPDQRSNFYNGGSMQRRESHFYNNTGVFIPVDPTILSDSSAPDPSPMEGIANNGDDSNTSNFGGCDDASSSSDSGGGFDSGDCGCDSGGGGGGD